MTTVSSEFHFSPRPNRAHEIAWQTWGEEAFARARSEDKPILLAISAVWCHWCHVMDETSYSNPEIIQAINERYVAVRVDNDRRPDVNARYNQGGWPTTAFLTPSGSLLAGATYLPPEQMGQALAQVGEFYRGNRGQIAQRALELRSRVRESEEAPVSAIDESIVEHVVDILEEAYDEDFGGFGGAPKFPMIDALEFLLQEHRLSGKQRLYDIVARSMLGMSTGGMYDHVEGGFFRYSTTRDWTVPHFEKMTEDHAGLLRILAALVRTTRNDRFRSTLVSALGYVRAVLLDPHVQSFAGSQDADESYYRLPLEERRRIRAPYVDRTSYSNWTAAMAGTFAAAGNALDDERTLAQGEAALDALHDRMRDTDGLLYHFVEPRGAPHVRGLLTDQSAYLRALIDAHEYGGQPRFLQRARELASAIETHFAAPEGGFYDHASIEDPIGNLALRDRPLADNASLAQSLLRLAALAEKPGFREAAQRALMLYAKTYESAGLFAAPYARAVRRYISPEASVVLVGTPQETSDLRESAHMLPGALLTVRTIDAGDTAALRGRGFDPMLRPVAYVCAAAVCAPPAHDAAGLREAYEQLVLRPKH